MGRLGKPDYYFSPGIKNFPGNTGRFEHLLLRVKSAIPAQKEQENKSCIPEIKR
jgi:hypothetical protein